MFAFLSPKSNRRDKVAARAVVCLFALIFFLCAALSALPPLSAITDFLAEAGLSGYGIAADEHSDAHDEAIEHFSDRPIEYETQSNEPQASDPAVTFKESPL